jgi:hypothetical protein
MDIIYRRIVLEEEVAVVFYVTLAEELVQDGLTIDEAGRRNFEVLLLCGSIKLSYAIALLAHLYEVYCAITLDGAEECAFFKS